MKNTKKQKSSIAYEFDVLKFCYKMCMLSRFHHVQLFVTL